MKNEREPEPKLIGLKEDSSVRVRYLLHDSGEVELQVVERKWGIDNMKGGD